MKTSKFPVWLRNGRILHSIKNTEADRVLPSINAAKRESRAISKAAGEIIVQVKR